MFSFFTLLNVLATLGFVASLPIQERQTTQSTSYSTLSSPRLSPYYVYFGNPSVTMSDAFSSLDMRSVTIGFMSAPTGKCDLGPNLNNLVADAQAFVAKGGAINLSFGGNLQDPAAQQQHVQQACNSADDLEKLIQSAMDQFGTHNIEFDIEDDALLSDADAAKRLGQALASLKSKTSDAFISYTMGTGSNGMGDEQVAWLQAANDAGLNVDILNLMTMNMGSSDVVGDAQSAIKAGAQQFVKVYGGSTDDAMKKMGVLPAIGVDNGNAVLTISDAKSLADFAKSSSLAMVSYWNFNRDFPGGVGQDQLADSSSSPDQTTPSQFFTTFHDELS